MTGHPTRRLHTSINRRDLLRSAAAGGLLAGLPAAMLPGRADAQLTAPVQLKVVMQGSRRRYNGNPFGPTIRTRAGETLRIDVENALDPETDAKDICPSHADHNGQHGANVTNLHTHGLHVSPNVSASGKDADNIFLSLFPAGQRFPLSCFAPDRDDSENWRVGRNAYEFDLPDFHPSGTFWYHAHKHGSTALQVSDGLEGALIIEDSDGYMPAYIAEASVPGREEILMIRRENRAHVIYRVAEDGSAEPNPTLTLNPGSVRRWRLINASPAGESFVRLDLDRLGPDTIEVFQIAFDGLTLDRRVAVRSTDIGDPWENHAALALGNRTDFIVHVSPDAAPGDLQVTASQLQAGVMHSDGVASEATPAPLTIRIEGPRVDDTWSTSEDLPGSGHQPISGDGAVKRCVVFNRDGDGRFAIDDERFTGQVKQPAMALNSVGDWTVSNTTGVTHPFHIHVNPFFVTHINGVELPPGSPLRRWQDTIALPDRKPDGSAGEVRFLTRFETFTGKFVIHCHILSHEDGGMMQAVEVAEGITPEPMACATN